MPRRIFPTATNPQAENFDLPACKRKNNHHNTKGRKIRHLRRVAANARIITHTQQSKRQNGFYASLTDSNAAVIIKDKSDVFRIRLKIRYSSAEKKIDFRQIVVLYRWLHH